MISLLSSCVSSVKSKTDFFSQLVQLREFPILKLVSFHSWLPWQSFLCVLTCKIRNGFFFSQFVQVWLSERAPHIITYVFFICCHGMWNFICKVQTDFFHMFRKKEISLCEQQISALLMFCATNCTRHTFFHVFSAVESESKFFHNIHKFVRTSLTLLCSCLSLRFWKSIII